MQATAIFSEQGARAKKGRHEEELAERVCTRRETVLRPDSIQTSLELREQRLKGKMVGGNKGESFWKRKGGEVVFVWLKPLILETETPQRRFLRLLRNHSSSGLRGRK